MSLFSTKTPRRFHHEYIYVDERKERLEALERRVRNELAEANKQKTSDDTTMLAKESKRNTNDTNMFSEDNKPISDATNHLTNTYTTTPETNNRLLRGTFSAGMRHLQHRNRKTSPTTTFLLLFIAIATLLTACIVLLF